MADSGRPYQSPTNATCCLNLNLEGGSDSFLIRRDAWFFLFWPTLDYDRSGDCPSNNVVEANGVRPLPEGEAATFTWRSTWSLLTPDNGAALSQET